MRNAFIQELCALAESHSNIALMVGDLGFSVVEPFIDQFPDRFFNAGVAEQNMAGMAAGLASEGYHVFTYSIANFPTFRCAEQLRNDIDYHNLAVTTVSVGGGLAYGNLGYSHHAVQDYALMRILPNMLIASPGDPNEVRACLKYLVENPQPSYLRLGKAGEPNQNNDIPFVQPGKWNPVLQRENNSCILTTGAALQWAFEWINTPDFKDYSVYSLPLWGMKTKSNQAEFIRQFDQIITLEDHLMDGGFGSWLIESVNAHPEFRSRILCKSLKPEVCGMVGSQQFLNKKGGILP